MKTVLQELIDELESVKGYPLMPLILRLMKDRLEKEKEQIMEAFVNGKNKPRHIFQLGEQYYNQTYSQDSKLPKKDKTFKQKSQWTKVNKKQQ